jgi:hypothetical protein
MRMLAAICIASSACHTDFTPVAATVTAAGADGSPTELLVAYASGFPVCANRNDGGVALLDAEGFATWSLGADDGLHGPHTAEFSPDRSAVLVSDTCNNRVRVFGYPSSEVLWDSSEDCPELDLSHPNSASFTGEGLTDTILISSLTDHRVIEVAAHLCGNGIDGDEIVWQYGSAPRGSEDSREGGTLRFPHGAVLEPRTGHVLITDSGDVWAEEGRVIEVAPSGSQGGEILWSYSSRQCTESTDGACAGLSWTRGADLTCDDETCRTGTILLTDRDETIRIPRDLDAWQSGQVPEPDLHIRYGDGYAYDAEWMAVWNGDDNHGIGWLLISHHGIRGEQGWLRVIRADDTDAGASVWELSTAP